MNRYIKRSFILCLLMTLSFGSPHLKAQELDDLEEYHVFSESMLKIEMSVGDTPCDKLVTSLIQRSSSMGIVVADNIETACNEPVSIKLPKVSRTAELRMKTKIVTASNDVELPQIKITVYPDNQLDHLRLLSAIELLYVDDRNGALIDALDKYEIGYQHKRLINDKDVIAQMNINGQKIMFWEKQKLFPVIVITPDQKIIFKTPFLKGLSESPAKQKTLVKLMKELNKL